MKSIYIKLLIISGMLFLFLFPILAQEDNSDQKDKITKIYIIRHAERDPGQNPPLNRKGEKRAQLIKEMLADSGITVIYTPDLIRNRQTAAPLARQLNIQPRLIPFHILDDTPEVARHVKNRIWNEDLGETILYIGNQKGPGYQMGNLQEFYKAIGGNKTPLSRYPDMHIVTLKDTVFVMTRHVIYGADEQD